MPHGAGMHLRHSEAGISASLPATAVRKCCVLRPGPLLSWTCTPKRIQGLETPSTSRRRRQFLQCRAGKVADLRGMGRLAEEPGERALQDLLFGQPPQQQRPPGFAQADDSPAPVRRKSRLRRALVELTEGDSLGEISLMDGASFHNLARQCHLDPRWHEQVTLMCKLGMTKSELRRLAAVHSRFFSFRARAVRPKLLLLRTEAGLEDGQLCMLLLRFPRIVEYGLEHLRKRADFFTRDLGLTRKQLQKVAMQAPMLLASTSVEETLKPRVELLQREIGLPADALPDIIARAPSALMSANSTLVERVSVLRSGGLSQEQIVKLVMSHPPVLQLSVSSMRERFDFLHSLGLTQEEITAICSRAHVLSLSVEANLAPKVEYLTQQMQHHVSSLAKYPTFLTMSLQHRIIPRHRYWERTQGKSVKKAMPLFYFPLADARFAEVVGNGDVQDYLDFKDHLWSGKAL